MMEDNMITEKQKRILEKSEGKIDITISANGETVQSLSASNVILIGGCAEDEGKTIKCVLGRFSLEQKEVYKLILRDIIEEVLHTPMDDLARLMGDDMGFEEFLEALMGGRK